MPNGPSGAEVSRVVQRLATGTVPGRIAEAKCSVVNVRRARCEIAAVASSPAVKTYSVWFKIRQSGSAWTLVPDCRGHRSDILCVALEDKVRQRRLRLTLGSGHCTSSTHGSTSELKCTYVSQ